MAPQNFFNLDPNLSIKPFENVRFSVDWSFFWRLSKNDAVSRGLAEAVAGTGITVNNILPGPTKSRSVTEFVDVLAQSEGKSFSEFEKDFFMNVRPTSLIKRFAAPEEVATLVTYIASPLSSATTGAALRVDGGIVKSVF